MGQVKGKAQGGNLGAAGISVPGSAGETHRCAVDKGLASIILADGPAGLRLMKYYHVNEGSIVSMPFEFGTVLNPNPACPPSTSQEEAALMQPLLPDAPNEDGVTAPTEGTPQTGNPP